MGLFEQGALGPAGAPRRHAATASVVLAGIVLSLAAFWTIQHQLQAHRRAEFEWVARERVHALYHAVGSVLEAVQSIRGYYHIVDRLEQEDFQLIARSLGERFPGIQSLAWVPRVTPDPREAYARAGWAGGEAGPIAQRASGDGEAPAGEGGSHYPVQFVEPLPRGLLSPGFDLASAPVFQRVLERAVDSGGIAVSGRVPLLGNGGEHYGFMACVPVFQRGMPVASRDQRLAHLHGFAVAVFRLDDLARASISRLEPRGVDVVVIDESADAAERLLDRYASRLGPAPVPEQGLEAGLAKAPLRLTETFAVADRRWSITAVATPRFVSAEAFAQGPVSALLAGLLFTGVNGLYLVRMRRHLQVRRRMADALREREELYCQMTETMDEVLWAADPAADRFLYLSPACEAIWGGGCVQFRDRVSLLADHVPAGDRRHLTAAVKRTLEDKADTEVEFRLRREGGEARWIRARAFPVLDAEGRVERVVGLGEDITSRKLAEKALRKSERKLRTLFNQSPDIIMTVDRQGAALLLNRSVPGLTAGRAQGGSSERLVPPEFRDRYRQTLDKVLGTGQIGHFRYALPDATWWEVRIVPIKQTKRVKGAMVIASDVTQKQVLQDQATRNARLASVGALSAGVAHEINNPNNAILFNASLFRRAWLDALPILDAYQAEHGDFALGGLPFAEFRATSIRLLQDVVGNSERIRRIIENLKHLARRGNERCDQVVDVTEVVQEAAAILRHPIQEHTDVFSLELAADLPPVTGNAQLLEQVFINLILNALQALPARDRAVRVVSTADTARGQVSVRVMDKGVGIAEVDRARLTEPFFTTRADAGGTGLGLSISRSIVERHHGTLKFDSQPGQGTTVTIALPCGAVGES